MALSVKPILTKKNFIEDSQSEKIVLNFVLLGCEKNMKLTIVEELRSLPTVSEIKLVEGMYDILVIMKSDSIYKIKQTIANNIRMIEGVRTTLALTTINHDKSSRR